MNLQLVKKETLELIGENKIRDALDNIKEFINSENSLSEELVDDFIKIKRQYVSLQREEMRGVLSYSDKNIEESKICNRLINLTNLLSNSIVNSQKLLPANKKLHNQAQLVNDGLSNKIRVKVNEISNIQDVIIFLIHEIGNREGRIKELEKVNTKKVIEPETDKLKRKLKVSEERYNKLLKEYRKLKKEKDIIDNLENELGKKERNLSQKTKIVGDQKRIIEKLEQYNKELLEAISKLPK